MRKRLNNINFDNGSVQFFYELNRQDFPNEKALTSILVRDKHNQKISEIKFYYDYFISKENCPSPECKRLKLNKITRVTNNNVEEIINEFEYFYDEKLPIRGSLEQDYLGFYNKNGVVNNSTISYSPTLYYYQNNGILSILPFPLQNLTPTKIINGNYSLIPNDGSLIGLLSKVKYPTSGYTEFEYENNTFNYLNNSYLGCGARIKKQKEYTASHPRIINYEYTEENGLSSGYFNNMPKFADLLAFNKNPYIVYGFDVRDFPKSGIELTQGNFIGYNRVIEKENNNGYTVNEFTSPKKFPNTHANVNWFENFGYSYECFCLFKSNSSIADSYIDDLDFKRGKLINQSVFDNFGFLKYKKDFFYSSRVIGLPKFYNIVNHKVGNISLPSSINIQNLLNEVYSEESFLLNKLINKNEKKYDNEYPYIKSEKKYLENNLSLESKYYYPHDLIGEPFANDMIAKNMIASPLKTEIFKNGVKISEQKTVFAKDTSTNNLLLPKNIYTAKFPNNLPLIVGVGNLEKKITYNQYDDKGNINQYTPENGSAVCIIWGYNKTQPIAKLENCSYTIIPASTITNLQSLSDTAGSEAALILALNALRDSLPNAMVTTYTHKPLIGVSTITDPKGDKITYHYDSFGRLQSVTDKNGNILSENEYHYKP